MKKILAVYNGKGSKYHRVYVPLTHLPVDKYEVVFVDKLGEGFEAILEIVKPDILYFHWNLDVHPVYLSLKKDFLVIMDVDDLWKPDKHIDRARLWQASPTVEKFMKIADIITVSTEYLKKEVLKIIPNADVRVLSNEIPLDNQPVKTGKRIGVCGSISHYNDWLTLKDTYKLALKKGYQFVFAGYNSKDKHWQAIRKIFNKATYIDSVKPEDSLGLYDNIDILLCPLEDTKFNRAKSSLKLKEAAVTGTRVLGSKLYRDKEDGLSVGYKIDRFEEAECPTYDGRKAFNQVMEKRCEILQIPKIKTLHPHHLYSIYYSHDQLPYCTFEPYLNPVKTKEEKSYLFEHNIILNFPDFTGGYTGFLSWKFGMKTLVSKEECLLELDADIVNFCKPIPNFFKFTERHHPGFTILFDELCGDLGLKYVETHTPIYANLFIARSEIYNDYKTYLKKAIDLLKTDKYKDVWKDSTYKGVSNLKELTGLDYYPFHTFLLERLINAYTHTFKIEVKNYS